MKEYPTLLQSLVEAFLNNQGGQVHNFKRKGNRNQLEEWYFVEQTGNFEDLKKHAIKTVARQGCHK